MPLSFNFGEENRPELFEGKPKTPVTLLSGFLGTGKTSLLKHLLENQDGVRIGVVVNDVAAVNIDSQLVKRYEKGFVEVAELQNGCVCCSSADDLFSAVQNVVMRSKDHAFEHIVVELSGVGEPEAVKKNWAIGLECTMPVALRTEVKRVITVVDASTFGKDWLDTRKAQERNEEVHGDKHDEKNKARLENVGLLLAEQVEWADVVVVNKVDIASEDELQTTLEVVRALNPTATLHHASFGRVSPNLVLPSVPKGLKLPERGEGEGYSWSQTATDITLRMFIEPAVKGRDIDFKVGKHSVNLGLKGRLRPRVEGQLAAELKNVSDVMWEIEGSGSGRCMTVTLEKSRPGLWPGLLEAGRESSYTGDAPVSGEVDRTDFAPPSRSDASGSICEPCVDSSESPLMMPPVPKPSRAQERFGLHTFCFRRRRPFSGKRLEELLTAWPTPLKELFTLQDLQPSDTSAYAEKLDAILTPVLRSKGFCWIDSEPLKQYVWAHAGKTLSVLPTDWWWGALDREQLKFRVSYPGVESEYKMVRREKWDAEFGDRRQELVFIGGPQMREQDIVALLERCLLSEDEFKVFRENTKGLRVPDDDFHVNGLLKNLGATQQQIQSINQKSDNHKEEDRLARRQDREDTDFLRSLGVGCNLEPSESDGEQDAAELPSSSPSQQEPPPPVSFYKALPAAFEVVD